MNEILIFNLTNGQRHHLRLDRNSPNFRLGSDKIEAAALHPLDPATQDFIEVAAAVFYADGEIPRGGATRPGMGANWRRKLRFEIPVRCPDLWTRPDIGAKLTETVRFLTDDDVEFVFSAGEEAAPLERYLDFATDQAAFHAEEAILFSGGLDSFAGALEVLATTRHNVVLISHRSASKVMTRQSDLAGWLTARFPGRIRHVKVEATRKGRESNDTTQRSRSLLFAAIGHAAAISFGCKRLNFYENGIVSHNLPISHQVVGTMATRTTHPRTMALLGDLMAMISADPPTLSNPYIWMTKREVVERIDRYGGSEMIETAVSCTHVWDQTNLHSHCGSCSQCLDRRFAILAAGLEAHDAKERYRVDVLLGPRGPGIARTLAVEWTRHAIAMAGIDDAAFFRRFALELTRSVSAFRDLPPNDTMTRILDLHRRHSQGVAKVLSAAIAEHSTALASHEIAPDSLLRLWIADDGQSDFDGGACAPDAPSLVAPEAEGDFVFDPGKPLEVRLRRTAHGLQVAVLGLADFEEPYSVLPHRLKDFHLQDLASGHLREDFRYQTIKRLHGPPLNEVATRKNVGRLRQQLAEAYFALVGFAPQGDLLIQSKNTAGYRIDPWANVVDFD
jgi:7-cyano-7-deazaguanine synthase in queuosine biosynthesis